jgi:hypothetical protein
MPGCLYIERRGARYYFRARIFLDIAVFVGWARVVAARGTEDARAHSRARKRNIIERALAVGGGNRRLLTASG